MIRASFSLPHAWLGLPTNANRCRTRRLTCSTSSCWSGTAPCTPLSSLSSTARFVEVLVVCVCDHVSSFLRVITLSSFPSQFLLRWATYQCRRLIICWWVFSLSPSFFYGLAVLMYAVRCDRLFRWSLLAYFTCSFALLCLPKLCPSGRLRSNPRPSRRASRRASKRWTYPFVVFLQTRQR